MDDRVVHAGRWTGAMESTGVPLTFVWGLDDPVSGAHMLAEIERRVPGATLVPLDGVGHWPMLEAPDRVTAAVRLALASSDGSAASA